MWQMRRGGFLVCLTWTVDEEDGICYEQVGFMVDCAVIELIGV
jgi:hypothetical protein